MYLINKMSVSTVYVILPLNMLEQQLVNESVSKRLVTSFKHIGE